MGQILFKKALPHIIAVATFLVLNVVYFYPQLEGKVVQQGDIVSFKGMSKELNDYKKLTGNTSQWTNAMFGGMPSYQISGGSKGNKIGIIERFFQLFWNRPIGYFNALMIGFYLMAVLLGVNPWLSMVGAIAFGFSTNHFVLFEAGHTSKLRAIAQFAPIIAGVLLTFRKKYWLGGILFALGMGLNIYANHVQMTYYLGLALFIYVLIESISFIKKGEISDLLKIGGILSLGLILAIGSSASNLLTTYEYSKDTMRGEPILTKTIATTAPKSSSEVVGLEWNYAMQWSNGVTDLVAGVIPGVVGGGSSQEISSSSATAKAMRQKGAQITQAPLYWGALPFTSGPVYYGAILCFLFLLGSLVYKGSVKWWLVIATIFTLLLSMGKNFELMNRFIFDYLPMYNKFRAPSSVTSITALLIPLLGILGLSAILKREVEKQEALKKLKIAAGIFGIFTLFFAFVGPNMFDFNSVGDANYQQRGWDVSAFITDRKTMMRNDALRTFALMLASAGLIWAFITNKIKAVWVIAAIGVLSLLDLWSVDKRYLSDSNFVNKQQYSSNYQLRPADQQIYQTEGLTYNPQTEIISSSNPIGRGAYRVLDLSINTFNSSSTSYFHNTIGGYHAAKLQRAQDIIDQHISQNNTRVLNMLNTKYFIDQQGQLQQNPQALGTAWFVDNIRKVNTPNEEIDALNSINPADEAVVLDNEFNNYIGSFDPQKNGTIDLTSYKPNELVYKTNTSSEQLAVFSEVWYGQDKGWNAYVDGEEVNHIRADYILRAMKVPTGEHEVVFKFEPNSFYTGETISTINSIIILLLILALLGLSFKEFVQNLPVQPITTNSKTDRSLTNKTKLKRKKKR